MDDQGGIRIGVKGRSYPNITPFPKPKVLTKDEATHFECGACGIAAPRDKVLIEGKDGKRRFICVSCRAEQRSRKVQKKREQELNSQMNALVSRGKSVSREDLPALADLLRGMIRRYKGIEGFCDRWFAQITIKENTDPGSKTVLDQYTSIAKMTGEVQKIETERRKVDRLTEEELEAEIQEYLKKMISPEVYTQEVIENRPDATEMTGEQLEAALNKEMDLNEPVE